jgi:hypothetical protein
MNELEIVKIDDLIEDQDNARHHPEDNIKSIAKSLEEFGQQTPIVINQQGLIIKGNGTVRAAKSIGWTELRAIRTKLTETRALAYSLVDNKSSDLAKWDEDQLTINLDKINEIDDLDMADFGFSDDDEDDFEWEEDNAASYKLSFVQDEWKTLKDAAKKFCEKNDEISVTEDGISAIVTLICSEWLEACTSSDQ